jgi:hypothetical protein
MPLSDDPKEDGITVLDLVGLERGDFSASSVVVCKLLRAIAGGADAGRNRYDTILIAAAEMIEAFERVDTGSQFRCSAD